MTSIYEYKTYDCTNKFIYKCKKRNVVQEHFSRQSASIRYRDNNQVSYLNINYLTNDFKDFGPKLFITRLMKTTAPQSSHGLQQGILGPRGVGVWRNQGQPSFCSKCTNFTTNLHQLINEWTRKIWFRTEDSVSNKRFVVRLMLIFEGVSR